MGNANVAIVTGAAGFLGSHMVDLLLSQGFEVRGIDNLAGGRLENLSLHSQNELFSMETVDLRSNLELDKIFSDVQYVFHFAGKGDIVPSIEQPADYMSTNIMGTVNVLEASRKAGVSKFVYAASSSCYGVASELPTTENAVIDPKYPYALSKKLGEDSVLHWSKVYDLPSISIRIFNAYGPRSRTTGVYGAVFGVFLAQKLAGKPYTIVGDGSQSRDFIFATDVAEAFLAAAESDRVSEVYNLGAGNPQSINRLVEILGGERESIPKRPGEPDCTWADIRKIKEQLDWEPKVSFEEGVSIMIQNIEYWSNAPLWDQESIRAATSLWFKTLGS